MSIYLKNNVSGNVIRFNEDLDENYYEIGHTINDFYNDKWVKLNNKQINFLNNNSNLTPEEIISCKIIDSAPELSLDLLRQKKIKEIKEYDMSPDINVFFINEMPVWWSKEKRNGLLMRIMTEEHMNRSNTIFWVNNIKIDLTIREAYYILYSVEDYAIKCLDNTQSLISSVENMQSEKEIVGLDYKTGYPEILKFNLTIN